MQCQAQSGDQISAPYRCWPAGQTEPRPSVDRSSAAEATAWADRIGATAVQQEYLLRDQLFQLGNKKSSALPRPGLSGRRPRTKTSTFGKGRGRLGAGTRFEDATKRPGCGWKRQLRTLLLACGRPQHLCGACRLVRRGTSSCSMYFDYSNCAAEFLLHGVLLKARADSRKRAHCMSHRGIEPISAHPERRFSASASL